MKPVTIATRARQDLLEIWAYIAKDSVDAANRVIAEIEANFQKLAKWPGMGHVRDDVKDARYRFWRVYSYLIVYLPDTQPLEVNRVVSGYRDLRKML